MNTNYTFEKIKLNAKEIIAKTAEKSAELATSSTVIAKEGAKVVKKSASSAKEQIVKTADSISQSSKDAQKAILFYVDKKKNAKFFETKMQSFTDGFKAGKTEAVDYVKKYANFCLATTAISYFFARCDGDINDDERIEIQYDLDAIIKNKDLPVELRNKLAEISLNENLTFDEVKSYLDGVSIETVKEFQKDIDEIILADGELTDSEIEAKKLFDDYLNERMEG